MSAEREGKRAEHNIEIISFFGSLRAVKCSCGWRVGCHTDRKALRLADEHAAGIRS